MYFRYWHFLRIVLGALRHLQHGTTNLHEFQEAGPHHPLRPMAIQVAVVAVLTTMGLVKEEEEMKTSMAGIPSKCSFVGG